MTETFHSELDGADGLILDAAVAQPIYVQRVVNKVTFCLNFSHTKLT